MKLKQIVILSGLLLAAAAQAEVRASQAWARFTVPGMNSGGVFMQLENGSPADALIGGSSPVAESVEIHEHVLAGYHVMLIGLKQPLTAGSRFPLTLKFRHAPEQTVQVEVKSPSDEAGGGQHHHHHHHTH